MRRAGATRRGSASATKDSKLIGRTRRASPPRGLRSGNRITSRIEWPVGQEHRQAIDPDALARRRRHAVLERLDVVLVVGRGLEVAAGALLAPAAGSGPPAPPGRSTPRSRWRSPCRRRRARSGPPTRDRRDPAWRAARSPSGTRGGRSAARARLGHRLEELRQELALLPGEALGALDAVGARPRRGADPRTARSARRRPGPGRLRASPRAPPRRIVTRRYGGAQSSVCSPHGVREPAGHLAHEPGEHLLGQGHQVARARVGLVELEHRELGIVLRRDALVAEVAVDLVDPRHAADDEALQDTARARCAGRARGRARCGASRTAGPARRPGSAASSASRPRGSRARRGSAAGPLTIARARLEDARATPG